PGRAQSLSRGMGRDGPPGDGRPGAAGARAASRPGARLTVPTPARADGERDGPTRAATAPSAGVVRHALLDGVATLVTGSAVRPDGLARREDGAMRREGGGVARWVIRVAAIVAALAAGVLGAPLAPAQSGARVGQPAPEIT